MKYIVTFLALSVLSCPSLSQNLVPNAGFENYTTCPAAINQGAGINLHSWFVPTAATPDYLNTCNNALSGDVGIPANIFGYQDSAEGNKGFAGIYALLTTPKDYKEYLACKLTVPMIPGTHYRIAIDVSLAEKISTVGCNGLGAFLFKDTLPSSYKTLINTLPYNAQVNFNSYGNITDTINWVTLADTILADSAYRYLIIGSISHSSLLSTTPIKPNITAMASYYYIDNVRIFPLVMTAVTAVAKPSVSIVPNPVKDRSLITISNASGKHCSMSVYNFVGQCVRYEKSITAAAIPFDRGSLPNGMYIYQLHFEDATVIRGTLVLE